VEGYQRISLEVVTIDGDPGDTPHDVDVDLRTVDFNGIMELQIITLTKTGTGIAHLIIEAEPLVRNADDDGWLTTENSTVVVIEDDLDVSTVGVAASWDISKAFDDSGSVDDHMGLQGIRFSFSDDTAGDDGTLQPYLVLR